MIYTMCEIRNTTFLALLLLAVTLAEGHNSNCETIASLAASEDYNTIVETSQRLLTGTWISEGCEIRPGPEYVLRSYTFQSDGSYTLIQHYYWDDSCSSPQLTIISYGRIQLRNSAIQPGAATGLTKITNITVTPQDNNAAQALENLVRKECPDQKWRSWRRYEEHTIYDKKYDEKQRPFNLWRSSYIYSNNHHSNNRTTHHSAGHLSCLGSLKWAFNELKLLKIQLRPIIDGTRRRTKFRKMELLLGDIHSNFKHREFYTPTSFQVPLVKLAKDEIVNVASQTFILKNSQSIPLNIFATGRTPPHLIEKPHLPPYIWGEWTSTRCEVRPLGLYLTRRFSFYPEDTTWIGEHKFYSDPFCIVQKFIVTAAGHFNLQGSSKEIKGSSNINFEIERASLTVLDQKMIYELRLPGMCGLGKWQINVPKELSSTNGCFQLGILIPSTQYDIVKIEMDYKGACLLFLGQANTDHMASSINDRPTAFQLPLVKCGDLPIYSEGLHQILNNNDDYFNSSSTAPDVFLQFLLICTIINYFR